MFLDTDLLIKDNSKNILLDDIFGSHDFFPLCGKICHRFPVFRKGCPDGSASTSVGLCWPPM